VSDCWQRAPIAFSHSVKAPTGDARMAFEPRRAQAGKVLVCGRRASTTDRKESEGGIDRCGLTFEDPDGYRVVLQRAAWDL
jgi:hypothetical protein